MTLASVPVKGIVVDTYSSLDGSPIEWEVVAQNADGDGITTLAKYDPLYMTYDAKEPQNPNTHYRDYGNPEYAVSNILQWLNSDVVGDKWYTAQHEYDQSPDTTAVSTPYADKAGFLSYFSPFFSYNLNAVTAYEVSRKVHIASYPNLGISVNAQNGYDTDKTYAGFIHNRILTAKQYDGYIVRGNGHVNTGDVTTAYKYNSYNWELRARDAWLSNYGIIPFIFVSSDRLVRYDEETKKYYTDFKIDTEYEDYGRHASDFNIRVKATTTNNPYVDLGVFIDGSNQAIKTYHLPTLNEFNDIKLPISSLSVGKHSAKVRAAVGTGTNQYTMADWVFINFTKTEQQTPVVISDTIGDVASSFSVGYQVYDDDGDSLNVVVKLDNVQIESRANVEQRVNLTATVDAARFNALSYGEHTLSIIAKDTSNNSTTEDIVFKKHSIPTVSLNTHSIGEVVQPFSVSATYDNADGGAVTIRVKIDGKEIKT